MNTTSSTATSEDDMRDIPEDVMKAARETIAALYADDAEYQRATLAGEHDAWPIAQAIARAIHAAVEAETERCAKKADAEAERHRLNYEHNGKQSLDLYYETAAINVAASIRTPSVSAV